MAKARRRWFPVALMVVPVLAAACSSTSSSSGSTTSSSSASSTSASSSSPGGETTGVTSRTVTVGNVSILSGPVPGLFEGAPYGVEAFFAYQNSIGGVDGRKLDVKSADDAFSCSNNQSVTQSLSKQVFAFVGSFSLYDGCGAKVLQANPQLSDVSESLDPTTQALANNFQPQYDGSGFVTGPMIWFKQQYPNAVKHVGALVSNVTSALDNWDNWKAAAEHEGFHISYERAVAPLETDFTSDILRMRNAGVQFLILFEDIASMGRILNAAQQQGWHPQVINSPGQLYDSHLFKDAAPGSTDRIVNTQTQALYLGGDRSQIPEVNLFLEWMNKTHPGFSPDLYSLYGWTSARLFVQALHAAGPNPTRSGLLAALKNIHSFNSNGILATSDPAGKKSSTCWIAVGAKNDHFYRITPAGGFRCNPGGYYNNPNPASS